MRTNKKLRLENLKVQSFITKKYLSTGEEKTLRGGVKIRMEELSGQACSAVTGAPPSCPQC